MQQDNEGGREIGWPTPGGTHHSGASRKAGVARDGAGQGGRGPESHIKKIQIL